MKKRKCFLCCSILAAVLMPAAVSAQMETITDHMYREAAEQMASFENGKLSNAMKLHLRSVNGEIQNRKKFVNAVRTARDVLNSKSTGENLTWYAVPAMSELQRLPDAYPLDGKIAAPVCIVTARDEYEPGSFVLYPYSNLGKTELSLTPFKTNDGVVFPQENLDLKVVKVWYQNGNGWYSYFGDTGLKLVPELLLNDENLIHADKRKKQNFARIVEKDGKVSEQWISAPYFIDKRIGYPSYREFEPFSCMKENFQDAPTLQPVFLKEGEYKQFFLTVHAVSGQAPGLYKGGITVKTSAETMEIPVMIRVLPFELPKPCTFGDTEKPFLVASYNYISLEQIMWRNGGNRELAEKQLEAVLADQVAHNQDLHWNHSVLFSPEFELTVNIMKRVGMRTDYLMGINTPEGRTRAERRLAARESKKYVENLGYKTGFIAYGDEPKAKEVISARNLYEDCQSEGLRFVIAGQNQVFYTYGYGYDFFNTAYAPENASATRLWNDVGHAWVAWYAVQHVGAENPAFNRRQNGIAPYLANYSALCNYAHHFGPYNDLSSGYKPMVFAYGSGNGVIDTLEWEGFREGIDDIRYATLMKRLAQSASASSDLAVCHAGRTALQYLAELDSVSCDMNEMRMEMIRYILKLRKLLNQ